MSVLKTRSMGGTGLPLNFKPGFTITSFKYVINVFIETLIELLLKVIHSFVKDCILQFLEKFLDIWEQLISFQLLPILFGSFL